MKAHTLKIDVGSVVARNSKGHVCGFGSGSQMTNMLQMPTHNNNKSNRRFPNPVNMHICTYNIRTFREEEKRKEFEEEVSKIKWDVKGLCETKCKGEHIIKLKYGHTLYKCGNANNNKNGVGFLINKKIDNRVIGIKGINERLAQLTLKINQRYKIKII